jgi:hypothetical protein
VQAPSGWYPDTTRPNTERYWDGIAWTEQARFPGVRPFESPVPVALGQPELHPPTVSMFESATAGTPPPPERSANGPKHRARRSPVIKVLSLLLALILVGGGAFFVFGRHTDAGATVADAVNSALASHSADITIRGSGNAAGGGFTLSGTGAIDFQQNTMQMTLQIAAGPETVNAQVVDVDDEIYMNLGDLIGQVLPGKSWVSLNPGQATQGTSTQSLGAGGTSLTSDPAAALQGLSQAGDTVTDLGASSIKGVDVVGYSVHLNSDILKREIAQGQLPGWMQQAASTISSPNIDYRVYVNGSGQLVRMTTEVTQTVSGQLVGTGITMDFSDYGAPVNVTAPPAGMVGTFQSFLQAAASLSGHSASTD